MKPLFLLVVLLPACSLFDGVDVTYRAPDSGSADMAINDADVTEDATTTDAATDAAADVSTDTGEDAGADMAPDAEADMDPGLCITTLPLVAPATGGTCTNKPTPTMSALCDIVRQTGCGPTQFCDYVVTNVNGNFELRVACLERDPEKCDYVAFDDVCAVMDGMGTRVSTCYPGSACLTSAGGICRRHCDLTDGVGCNADEFCVPNNPSATQFGFGLCFDTDDRCSML